MNVYEDITKTVGATPMIRLKRIGSETGANLFLKLEFFNPLGSVKDRIGLNMIEVAEISGSLKKGMRVIEPTSGNTGIALAFVCASKGYELTLTMPETMSKERRTLLLLLGAEVVLTPAALGMRGAVAKAIELLERDENSYMPSQFDNPANPDVHRESTALEIWRDTGGTVDIVVTGVGTGGTATGIGEVLKKKKPSVQIVVVEPTESPVISGGLSGPHKIQGIGAGFVPVNLNRGIIDSVEKVSSDEAVLMARKVIKEEGVPVGISSGAAMVAALRVAAKPENKGRNIVVMIPSYAERYLSTVLAEKERLIAESMPTTTVDQKYLDRVSPKNMNF